MTGAAALVALIADEGSFQPWDDDVVSSDLLGFVDTVPYPERLARARADAGTAEAVVTGRATCHGHDVVILAGAFAFLAGTQGVAAGERVTRAFERARELSLPVVGLPRSGGTRMQEGTLAFVQMAKIAAAVAQFRAGGGCYVSYLRDPTLGGVLASWGALGAVTFAEPSALVGLTGPRVVELLTGEPFPEGVMVAEHLHSHGIVDDVVAPRQLAERVARVLAVAVTPPAPQPAAAVDDVAVEEPSAWACVEATRAPDRPGVRDMLARWAQQMCAIGRALMSKPRLLMFDEPSLGLAPILVQQVFENVQSLRDEGLTILVVEQNLKKALETADRGYVIETGTIAQHGPAGELLADESIRAAYLGI